MCGRRPGDGDDLRTPELTDRPPGRDIRLERAGQLFAVKRDATRRCGVWRAGREANDAPSNAPTTCPTMSSTDVRRPSKRNFPADSRNEVTRSADGYLRFGRTSCNQVGVLGVRALFISRPKHGWFPDLPTEPMTILARYPGPLLAGGRYVRYVEITPPVRQGATAVSWKAGGQGLSCAQRWCTLAQRGAHPGGANWL